MKLFWIRSSQFLKKPLIFAGALFAIELAFSIYFGKAATSGTRFHGFFSLENHQVITTILFFYVRVALLYFFYGLALATLDSIFKIRFRISFYIWITFLGFLFLAIKYPQAYEDLIILTSAFVKTQLFFKVWILHLLLGGTLLYLVIKSALLFKVIRSPSLLLAQLLTLFCLAWFVKTNFSLEHRVPSSVKSGQTNTNRNLIIILVDSLRDDQNIENMASVGLDLGDFFNTSTTFKRVVSPLAQTHAALVSLFRGENPTVHGVRSNLGSQKDKYNLLKGSMLTQLKEVGYKVHLIQDVSEYSSFIKDDVIDSAISPQYSIQNIFISAVFKNKLVFSFFNNFLGHIILPEIENSNSFTLAYNPEDFAGKMIHQLSKLEGSKEPFVAFLHTCALHWPLTLPYPYYPTSGFPDHSKYPFSYISKFKALSQEKLNAKQWKTQSHFNQKLYKSGIDMTVQLILNPLFSYLHSSPFYENSAIVLMSDHGEELWTSDSKYPEVRSVQHGTSLLFGSKSEYSFLRIRLPNQRPEHVDHNFGVIDVIPWVANKLSLFKNESHILPDENSFHYSETGLWPFEIFPGQFKTIYPSEVSSFLKVGVGNQIYVNSALLPNLIQQKQRAIYYKNYKLVIYPSHYGYQDFLCNLQTDPNCEKNLNHSEIKIFRLMMSQMADTLHLDQKAGLLSLGQCSPFANGARQALPPSGIALSNYYWQDYFQSLECLYRYRNLPLFFKTADKLLMTEGISGVLKNYVLRKTITLCSASKGIQFKYYSQYLVNLLKKPGSKFYKSNDMEISRCRFNLQRTQGINGKNQFPETALTSDEKAKLLESFIKQSKNRSITNQKESMIRNYPYFRNLEDKNKLIQTLTSVADISEFDSQIRDLFALDLEYNFVEKMKPLQFERASRLFSLDKPDAVYEIVKALLTVKTQDIGYTDYLLFSLDLFLDSRVSEIRYKSWDVSQDIKYIDIKFMENEAGYNAAKSYLCKTSQNLCQKLKTTWDGYLKLRKNIVLENSINAFSEH